MTRTVLSIFLLLFTCAACFGQSSYRGLTPGQSTKAEAERVLGRPVKELSKTLVEYGGTPDVSKVFAQYDDESPAASLLRIELHCELENDSRVGCIKLYEKFLPKNHQDQAQPWDAYIVRADDPRYSPDYTVYHGAPLFIVKTVRQLASGESTSYRLGFYSRELYETATPKSCTGTFVGVWETNRGRTTFTRTPEARASKNSPTDFVNLAGSYSTDNGTVTGYEFRHTLTGEWKDATGGGTFELSFDSTGPRKAFTGTWTRTAGRGPREGTWEGRCVETKGGGND